MSNIQKILNGLGQATGEYSKDNNIYTAVVSNESADESVRATGEQNYATLKDTIESTLDGLGLGNEDRDAVGLAAAKVVAAYATSPKDAIALSNESSDIKADIVVNSNDLSVASGESLLANESFSEQDISNVLNFSVAYNFAAARQGELAETFFATYVCDPKNHGYKIETSVISVYDEFNRSTDGSPKSFNDKPIIKHMFDDAIFGQEKHRLFPVKRSSNEALLLKDYAFTEDVTGENLTTAPIKIGKTVDLLGISQTDEQVQKGIANNTDELDPRLIVDSVYYSVKGDNGSGTDVTEMFRMNTGGLVGSNFVPSQQGHQDEMVLNFSNAVTSIEASSAETADGSSSAIFGNLGGNYTIEFKAVLKGDAKVDTGSLIVYGVDFSIQSIKTGAGVVLSESDSTYQTIANKLKELKIEGVTVESYRTNTNLRVNGQQVRTNRYSQGYNIPVRSGLSATASIVGGNTDMTMASKIDTLIKATRLKTNIDAVDTLVRYARDTKSVLSSEMTVEPKVMGAGAKHCFPFYSGFSIDVAEKVSSVKSHERLEDIGAYMLEKLAAVANDMVVESNYENAFNVLNEDMANDDMYIAIGTDRKTAKYLLAGKNDNKVSLGAGIVGVVVTDPNPKLRGKIYMAPVVMGDDRNEKPNPLQFGTHAWIPEIVTEATRTINGATTRDVVTDLKYMHVVNLPIIAEIDVKNTNAAIDKVAVNTKSV